MTLAFDQQARAESQTVAPPHQQPLPGALREEFAERFGAPLTTSTSRRPRPVRVPMR
jgi:hypothetical protein